MSLVSKCRENKKKETLRCNFFWKVTDRKHPGYQCMFLINDITQEQNMAQGLKMACKPSLSNTNNLKGKWNYVSHPIRARTFAFFLGRHLHLQQALVRVTLQLTEALQNRTKTTIMVDFKSVWLRGWWTMGTITITGKQKNSNLSFKVR